MKSRAGTASFGSHIETAPYGSRCGGLLTKIQCETRAMPAGAVRPYHAKPLGSLGPDPQQALMSVPPLSATIVDHVAPRTARRS